MGHLWRKGCLCGCLYEEECANYRPPTQRVEHVHIVHVIHDQPRAIEYVDSDVDIIRELEG